MSKTRALVILATLLLLTGMWMVLGPGSKPTIGHEGPDEVRRAPIVIPKNPVDLKISLGLKDETQVVWEGEIKVTGGEILRVEKLQGSIDTTIEGAKFKARSQRDPAKNAKQQAKKAEKKNANKKNADQKKNEEKKAEPVEEKLALLPIRLRVMLDAPLTAKIEVNTSRGNFSFTLNEIAAGSSKKFLNDEALAERDEAAAPLTGRETEDDFPVMAKAKDGTIWLAYVEYKSGPPILASRIQEGNFDILATKGHGDRIRLMRHNGKSWDPAMDATAGGLDVWRPAIAVDAAGAVNLVWSQKVNDDWDIFTRRYTPAADGTGKWSDISQVTKAKGADIYPVVAADSNGKVWLAWQAWREGQYDILLTSLGKDGTWSAPQTVSQSKANDWSPAITADSKGRVYVAWDTYDRGNYDVMLRTITADVAGSVTRVAESPKFEARACLTCDAADRVWIGYEEGDEQWGKDYANSNEVAKVGLEKNLGYALYVNRTVKVKCLDGGTLKQPAAGLVPAFSETLTRGKSVPRLAVDADRGLWLLLRHHPLKGGAGETWVSYALRYDGKKWGSPQLLPSSSNLMDNRPALAQIGQYLLAVYSGDDRTRTQDRGQNDLYSTTLKAAGPVVPPELVTAEAPAAATMPNAHPNEAEDVARLRAHRVTVGGKQLRPVRGEFHRHTEYSAHRDADGLVEDSLRYGLDAGKLDWMGNGDHDNGLGHEYLWWLVQKQFDLHFHPPYFVSAMTYERSVVYPNGHRNVMMPRRGIQPLPRGDIQSGTAENGTPDTKMLYAYLKHFGGICSSHTSGTNMGTDWRDNDPEVEPVVEIYQGHRHNYEHFGAPRSATAATQIGGYQEQGFIWHALAKGYRLGFQSSSDHISTHLSYGIALVDEMSRQGIIDAFKKRHSYAATDNILLVVRSGEQLMGDIFETKERPTLTIEATGTAPIARLHVVRDNKYVYSIEPKERQLTRTWTDMDAQAGKTSYYYVRIEQEDGNLAWASPMWITYKP